MATKKATNKNTKRSTAVKKKAPTAVRRHENTLACAALLFAGGAVAILGCLQDNDDIKLLLVGFGAALLVFGGALIATMLQNSSKR